MATLTIDISQQLKDRLQDVAKQQGLQVEDLVRRTLEALAILPTANGTDPQSLTCDERARRIEAVFAKYANLPGSVDEFLASKHEDTEREEARRAQRYLGEDES
jgi:hypothetical protein